MNNPLQTKKSSIKQKIAGLKRTCRFIEWRDMRAFSRSLDEIVDAIEQSDEAPCLKLKIWSDFFETDSGVFNRCDDSNGSVGGVYRYAVDLFVENAKQCEDKQAIAKLLLKLNKVDDFGIRSELIGVALACGLDESLLRFMVDEFQKRGEKLTEKYEKQHQYMLVEMLAKQLGDAELFEQASLVGWDELPVVSRIETAEIHFANGDIDAASASLNSISANESYMARERDALWLKIYQQQGNAEKTVQVLSNQFNKARSVITLKNLLDEIGEDKREQVLDDAVTQIHAQESFESGEAIFLLKVGRIDEAQAYLFKHAGQINGQFYSGLLSLIDLFEDEDRYLAMSIIYRRLLLAILERAYNKAYYYAVRYLKKLDRLDRHIDDWQGFESHLDFKKMLMQIHGRKTSFWSKYDGK